MVCSTVDPIALTPRERQVLALMLREGMTRREIAAALGISQQTVKEIVARAKDRLPATVDTSRGSRWLVRLAYVLGRAEGRRT